MATYAAYRHIELDKVGCGKKRVNNQQSSEIFNVISTPSPTGNHTPKKLMSNGSSANSTPASSRRGSHSDSFNRLFGTPETTPKPRRASIPKQDVTNRNPVTGNGVDTWDSKHSNRTVPKVHIERNPVTGEVTTIITPPPTPKRIIQNGYTVANGCNTPVENGHAIVMNGGVTNGIVNGHLDI